MSAHPQNGAADLEPPLSATDESSVSELERAHAGLQLSDTAAEKQEQLFGWPGRATLVPWNVLDCVSAARQGRCCFGQAA